MNCPESTLIYNSKTRSYRDLPLRFSEIGRLFRREKSGELNGLFRVRQLTMDDAHLYVTPEQIETEIKQIVALVEDFYKIFSFKPEFKLATKPKDSMGEVNLWKMAEKSLEKVLKKKSLKYEVKSGEGAFYGPKIDIYIKDALERNWQMATIQLDFQMPLNFALKYTDPEGKTNTPVMIHRAIFGSFERFIGILTEHYVGAFPVWLSPVQAIIIPITEKEIFYAQKVFQEIKEAGIRVELDDRNETTSAKIRDAELQKVPYMIVVGPKEVKAKNVSVRARGGSDLPAQAGQGEMKLEKFISKIQEKIAKKK
jgi:threonyl-tRNA synthetase